VNRSLALLGIASLACAGALFAQSIPSKPGSAKKSAAAAKDPAAVKRGHDVFQEKCGICHFDTSEAKKIGPGLKGLNKRGTFSVNGNKVTDENLKTWIENGDSLMPPFKEALEEAQIKDVIAYVKTL
jgi:mono/diheme cytochrome c family protein